MSASIRKDWPCAWCEHAAEKHKQAKGSAALPCTADGCACSGYVPAHHARPAPRC